MDKRNEAASLCVKLGGKKTKKKTALTPLAGERRGPSCITALARGLRKLVTDGSASSLLLSERE